MKHVTPLLLAGFGALFPFALQLSAQAADSVPRYVNAALTDPGRPPEDIARDSNRKAAEVIAFSQMKPGDKVIDFMPGGGYYTRIFAKLVGPKGHVYAIVPYVGPNPQFARAEREDLLKQGKPLRPRPIDAILQIQNVADYGNVTALWEGLNQYGGTISAPEQVDVVWTSDNYHDLHNKIFGAKDKPLDMVAVDKAIFASLKPGGVFLVLDHAAAKGAGFSQTETLHRADADAVKAEILQAGFKLDGESNVLVNAADDHTKPIFQMHDMTDQFVLRFKKPLTATGDKRPPANAFDGFYDNTVILGTTVKRWMIYHKDLTYQEFGLTGTKVQHGTWYWDAMGHNCMLHQYPADENAFVVCHASQTGKKVGDSWMEDNGGGQSPFKLVKGNVYPPKEE
jgi:predicted methyltransferase